MGKVGWWKRGSLLLDLFEIYKEFMTLAKLSELQIHVPEMCFVCQQASNTPHVYTQELAKKEVKA